MKVSGFTFVKNAVIYDYPICEAIRSILPLCDEVLVAVGSSEDKTPELIQAMDEPKIRIIKTTWDESLREGGRVLAKETDKAFHAISPDSDWAIYIQGDEVLHEKYHMAVRQGMLDNLGSKRIDGLLLRYLHFYGSFDFVGDSSNWYSHEVRVVRNDRDIFSYRDAQGFRKKPNKKLRVKAVDACMYHYGWVKPPVAMQEKQRNFNRYWHDDQWIEEHVGHAEKFDYAAGMKILRRFRGSHPECMMPRIKAQNWEFDYDPSMKNIKYKDRMKNILKRYFGIDTSYRNYKLTR